MERRTVTFKLYPNAVQQALRWLQGDHAQDAGPASAYVSSLRPHDEARPEQRSGGSQRCAHAWDGCSGKTKSSGTATLHVNVCDRRNPRHKPKLLAGGKVHTFLLCCSYASPGYIGVRDFGYLLPYGEKMTRNLLALVGMKTPISACVVSSRKGEK